MRGVWRSVGTRAINSNPRKTASAKIVIDAIS
jgi:hypothetical protein